VSGWTTGARIAARGHAWILEATERGEDCAALHLARDAAPGTRATLLTPFDRFIPLPDRQRASVVPARRWLQHVKQLAATCDPAGSLKSLATARIDLLPHQLEPALAVFGRGATRMLIADGVGLGKTIQAGLIAAEHTVRTPSARTLILVPAGLRDQWRRELDRLFALQCVSADAAWLRAAAADRPSGSNPWALPGTYLTSIDFVKQPEALRPLEDVHWDLVVLDEAHTASAGSDRRIAAHAVACRSRLVVLLTATPRTDDPAEHEALCGIGRIDAREGPLLLFRRSQREIGRTAGRRCALLFVRPSAAELRMHQLLDDYTRRVWRESARRGDELGTLAAIVLRKRALSSAASLAASVRRRFDLLVCPAAAPAEQLRLPIREEEPLDDDEPDGVLAAPGLSSSSLERRWLAVVAEAAQHAAASESKILFVRRMLRRIREPLLIFTEYRDTLARLKQALSGTRHQVFVLHGGMRPLERSRVQHAFNSMPVDLKSGSHAPILIATDAAAEGLNLHLSCRVVIHYELPWSTARLEQRAGRVDRLGQRRTVHECGLVAATTAERLVLGPLMRRVARARSSGHAADGLPEALAESHVAELIMGSGTVRKAAGFASAPPPQPILTYTLDLADAASSEAARVVVQRQLWKGATPAVLPGTTDFPLAAVVRRQSAALAPGFVVVQLLRLSGRLGEAIHDEPIVWHAPWVFGRRKPSEKDVKAIVEEFRRRLATDGAGATAVRIAEALDRSARVHHAVESARAQRTRLVLGSLRIQSQRLVQQGLFERRPAGHSRGPQGEPLPSQVEAEADRERPALMAVDVRLAAVLLVMDR
jgi:superfamily II DNA or RNA helicase